jgi:serine/threonine-protein kinase
MYALALNKTIPWRPSRFRLRARSAQPVAIAPRPGLLSITGAAPWCKDEEDAPQAPRTSRYTIERYIGAGGGGNVWLAWDKQRCRLVALKCLRPQLLSNPGAAERFEKEAVLTASLVHAGVPRVYDHGQLEDGTHYYTQRYVEGRNLAEELAARGDAVSRPDPDLLRRFARVCWTAAYAHRRGIVHLDIKPSNILLDAGNGAQLIDWGVSRHLDDAAPSTPGSLFGTLGYMAPECLRAGPTAGGCSADVFSLGMTLFEMLAGRRPFEARNELAFAVKVCCERAPDPRELAPAVPAELAELCNLALDPEPEGRQLTAAGMARAIERWLVDSGAERHAVMHHRHLR